MSSKHTTTESSASGTKGPHPALGSKGRADADPPPSDASAERTERIRTLAYGFFLERGAGEGHALDDWLQAEARVVAQEGNGRPLAAGR